MTDPAAPFRRSFAESSSKRRSAIRLEVEQSAGGRVANLDNLIVKRFANAAESIISTERYNFGQCLNAFAGLAMSESLKKFRRNAAIIFGRNDSFLGMDNLDRFSRFLH
jgi:hypothetical protein